MGGRLTEDAVLDHQHRVLAAFRQAVGHGQAGGAASDNDIVVLVLELVGPLQNGRQSAGGRDEAAERRESKGDHVCGWNQVSTDVLESTGMSGILGLLNATAYRTCSDNLHEGTTTWSADADFA